MRQLRKQSLILQARRYRLALRQDLESIAEPLGMSTEAWRGGKWLPLAATVMSALPNRWARLLSIGMLSWRLVRRLLAVGGASPSN